MPPLVTEQCDAPEVTVNPPPGGEGEGGGGELDELDEVLEDPEQVTPAPSLVPQFSLPQALREQSARVDSEPEQATLSIQKLFATVRNDNAAVASPRPSSLHATVASLMSQLSSQT